MTDLVLRSLTQGAYDLQKVRIGIGNRICQAYYQAQGVQPGEKPDDVLDDEEKKILEAVRSDYRRLTDGLVRLPRKAKFEPTKYISSYALLIMVKSYEQTLQAEETAFKSLEDHLDSIPIWREWLKDVRGCGPAMAAVMLSRFDIHKAVRPSQFWAFAGLDVAQDGRGRSRRKEHLVEREYVDRNGEVSVRKSITFDPWLKTKLYVLGTSFLRQGAGPYRSIYDGYKNRLKHRPDWADRSDGHRHNAAIRYMIKMFLLDLWREWRGVEGLPIVPPYAEEKLGRTHKAA